MYVCFKPKIFEDDLMIIVTRRKYFVIGILLLFILILACLVYNSISTTNFPYTGNIILIDPGHGGEDPGAVGKIGKPEKDINLEISNKLKALLEQNGFPVMLTRDTDISLHDKGSRRRKISDIKNRKELVENYNPKLFISIHLNSFPQEKYSGAQVFYPPNSTESKVLGEMIQEELRNVVDNNNKRQAKQISSILILKNLDVPAVIVECGFLSNIEEAKLLNTNEHQQKIATAISNAIIKYLSRPQVIPGNTCMNL